METDEPIAKLSRTNILWALPMTDHALSSDDLHEVGMLSYTRGNSAVDIARWKVYQGICTNYGKGANLFNLEGLDWSEIVSTLGNTYVKFDTQQDTAYWSEDKTGRIFEDQKVAIKLERPSLSNTFIFKAGETYEVKIGYTMISESSLARKSYGTTTLEWNISEKSLNGAFESMFQPVTVMAVISSVALAQLI